MARYLELANQLNKDVTHFLENLVIVPEENRAKALAALGHIINLAVRCNPRQPQGTVRKNIVATAMKDYCHVTMTKEQTEDGREYNAIHITPNV